MMLTGKHINIWEELHFETPYIIAPFTLSSLATVDRHRL